MLVTVREMEEEDSHLRLDNLESIGMNQLKTIKKILEKNNILMDKLFKINKMDQKIASRESSNLIIQVQEGRLRNLEDNLKIELIKQVLLPKEWDITSEPQFQKRLPQQQHNKASSPAKPARNSTTALPNLPSQQKQVIHQRILIRPTKILS